MNIDCLLRKCRNSIFFSLLRVAYRFGMKFHAESIDNTCLKNLKKWSYDLSRYDVGAQVDDEITKMIDTIHVSGSVHYKYVSLSQRAKVN